MVRRFVLSAYACGGIQRQEPTFISRLEVITVVPYACIVVSPWGPGYCGRCPTDSMLYSSTCVALVNCRYE